MARPADDALLGRTIAGKYVIESFLGGGATGAVYKAHQLSLEKSVAIKILHPDLRDATFVARFQREAQAASRLDHPNSMRVLDYGLEAGGLCYIAMELLTGESLFQILKAAAGPLPERRTVDLTRQMLAALAVAHEMGIVHRDLKPENIIVVESKADNGLVTERVKVCDFGMAKIKNADAEVDGHSLEKLSTQGIVVGTPEYMSPEQGKGEELDGRSDLYAVGIILYQMLTGRLPFEAHTHIATLVKQLVEAPKPPSMFHPDVNPALEEVCLRALRKEREERFANAREMRSALRRALEPEWRGSAPESSVNVMDVPPSRGALFSAPEYVQELPPPVPLTPPARRARAMDLVDSTFPRASRGSWGRTLFVVLVLVGIGVYAAPRWRRWAWLRPIVASVYPAAVAAPVKAPEPPAPSPGPPASAALPASAAAPVVTASAPPETVTDAGAQADAGESPADAGESPADAGVDAVATAIASASPGRAGKAPAGAKGTGGPTVAELDRAPVQAAGPTEPSPYDQASVVFGAVRSAQAPEAELVAAMPLARFAVCYRQGMRARGGPIAGTGTLRVSFGATGYVHETSFAGPAELSPVGKCVADQASGIRIRNVRAGGGAGEIDLTFRPDLALH